MYDLAAALRAEGLGRYAKRLELLAYETKRKRRHRAAPSSKPVTEEMRARIRNLHEADPDMRMDQIAALMDVNPGRVYEVLYGKRQ